MRQRTQAFTLVEILVAVVLVVSVAGVAATMATNRTATDSLEFDEQLGTMIRSMPAAAASAHTTVTLSVNSATLRLSTGQKLNLPQGIQVNSNMAVTEDGATGYVWRVIPGVSCLRYGLQAYGSLERVGC